MKKNMAEKHSKNCDSDETTDAQHAEHAHHWVDPREKKDRRQINSPSETPASGCRRTTERRVTRYIRDDQWWLHRSYNNGED